MQIVDYAYAYGTERRNGYIAIPQLDRNKPTVTEFLKHFPQDVTLIAPTAVLYINGFSMSPSDANLNPVDIHNYVPVIKTGASYIAHAWISTFKNNGYVVHVDTISGTCAAGIQAIWEAERLLDRGIEEVIIIGCERTSPDTLRLFNELRIPVTCGDGFVFVRVRKGVRKNEIRHIQWSFQYNPNPFLFYRSSLNSLKPWYPVNYVKLHGTGTKANEEAEEDLAKLGIPLRYKPAFGHTQGVSALLETCAVLDDPNIRGTILVTANGLGGYYGAFTLIK